MSGRGIPDREKILRGAECCKYVEPSANGCPKDCPYLPEGHLTCGLDPFLDDVIALLREQEPVEPWSAAWSYLCGKCKKPLRERAFSYCPWCGRRIKWPD